MFFVWSILCLIRPAHSEANGLFSKKLEKLLKVLVVLMRPCIRIILVVVALLKAAPRGEALQERIDTHFKDILAIELVGIDMEMVSTPIQILSQLLWDLHSWQFIDLLNARSIIERLPRAIIHQQRHVNKEIKTHLEAKNRRCWISRDSTVQILLSRT